jgi:hypothetical protein
MCGCFQVIERGFGTQGREICLRQIKGGQLLGRITGGIVHFLNDDLNAVHTALHGENTAPHILPYAMELDPELIRAKTRFVGDLQLRGCEGTFGPSTPP